MLDFGFALFGLLGLVCLLGLPYLLVSHSLLKSRVRDLEAKVQSLEKAGTDGQYSSVEQEPEKDTVSPAGSLDPGGQGQQVEAQSELDEDQVVPPEARGEAAPAAQQVAQAARISGTDRSSSSAAGPGLRDDAQSLPPRAFVLRGDLAAALGQWLRENWVLVAGSASLALAGLFMVQYGVENGLLTPFWRVMASLGFGSALIVAAEIIRRRLADATEGATQHLPSALAGAGVITLFAGVLSARVLYLLIEPGLSFVALCLVSVLALVLGWFYGALLTALGLLGASVVPFLVGGQSQDPWMLYYYFALIATVGLGVDTVKRWAWISGLSLAAPLSASLLLYLAGAGTVDFLISWMWIAAVAVILPERSLWPRHAGPASIEVFWPVQGKRIYPEFPTRISAAATCAVGAAALFVALRSYQAEVVIFALVTLVALLLACLVWMRQAPALFDHALVPGGAILALVLFEGGSLGPLFQEFQAAVERPPETAAPQIVWALVAIGVLGSGLAYLRMLWSLAESETEVDAKDHSLFWGLCAASFAPAMILILEFTWAPAVVHGVYTWALVVLAVAAAMTVLSERCARGPSRRRKDLRVSLFAISALTLIAFALFLVLAKTALTLALSVMVLLVILIDRKYDLPELLLFVQIGVAVITYRLVLDPGVAWALDRDYLEGRWQYVTPLFQIFLGYLGSLTLLGLGWLGARHERKKTALILESAATLIAAVFLSVVILRLLPEQMRYGHAGMGLMATVWTASLINQLHRIRLSGAMSAMLRGLLILGYGLAALASFLGLFFFANPLLSSSEMVRGPFIFDSLAAAYLPLAAVLSFAALRLDHLLHWVRRGFAIAASVLSAIYVTFEIRRFWRGDDLSLNGVIDAELYSYTVALLLASAGLLLLAFWRRSDTLRRLAMAGVVLTIAKVFLVDMSGLSGLTRVFSFMGLGLALVGLAWLNRVMNAQWSKGAHETEAGEPQD